MASTDSQLHGIYGNHQFMDHLYRYGAINYDIAGKKQAHDASASASEEIKNGIEKCAMHRVSSINICLSEIKSKAQDSNEWKSYFNYIRWNRKTIGDELNFYLQQPHLEKHRETISACRQLLNYVMIEYYNFPSADMAVFTEYKHVYDMITNSRRQPSEKVLRQAGRLFVNFINILTRRYYYEETEESDIKFAEIELQAGVIKDKLMASRFRQQADAVRTVYDEFINLKTLQCCDRVIQNELIKKALTLAHERATETVFQTAKRLILDSISKVQSRLRDGLRTAIRVG